MQLSGQELYDGYRIAGVFTADRCLGYVLINIFQPDAFDYEKCGALGIKVLIV